MIKQAYLEQVLHLTGSQQTADECWQEIELAYTEPGRYYHTMEHLQHLYNELHSLKEEISDWETLFFSLCYHDVVYDVAQNVVANDNEVKSAAFAERQLQIMHYPAEKITKCREQIMATQKHHKTNDGDTNLLNDADLCILGQPWEVYAVYYANIRKEFSLYPDSIYNKGRRKVLEHFQTMEPLFKTTHFNCLYEEKAKANIRTELQLLQG